MNIDIAALTDGKKTMVGAIGWLICAYLKSHGTEVPDGLVLAFQGLTIVGGCHKAEKLTNAMKPQTPPEPALPVQQNIAPKVAALVLACSILSGCGSIQHAYDGLTSPQGVEDRAKLKADWATLRAKLEIVAPELLQDAEAIAADAAAGNYVGALMSIVAAVPMIADAAPEILADVKTLVADLRALGADAHYVEKADNAVATAKVRAAKKKAAPKPVQPGTAEAH